jgi:hypothetical protein
MSQHDTFPGLDADCGSLIRQSHNLTTLARLVRAQIAQGDIDGLRQAMREVNEAGDKLHALTSGFSPSSIIPVGEIDP